MTETSEAAALAGIVNDIAALARKLAEQEPYKSASGLKLCGRWQRILTRWLPVTGQVNVPSFVLQFGRRTTDDGRHRS